MSEKAPSPESRVSRVRTEPAVDVSRYRRRRRVQLRHNAAVVAAEIRRMRRAGWSDPSAARY